MVRIHTLLPGALAAIAAGAVFTVMAQDAELQRADVTAALAAARADGSHDMLHGEDSGSFRLSQQPLPLPASRAEVADAVRVARNGGRMNALHGEDSGSFVISAMPAQQQQRRETLQLFAGPVAD